MMTVQSCAIPPDSLLSRYLGSGHYTDCYMTEMDRAVPQAEFIEAFYTSGVFKLERLILQLVASRPSTDAQAGELGRGELDSFAAWSVEARSGDELLMRDLTGRTRSWLMVAMPERRQAAGTRLFFGSVVVAKRDARTGRRSLGPVFTALLGFHKLYSRVLLLAARAKLARKLGTGAHAHRDDA